MTRKEASFILMLAKNRVRDDELNEALDMAIKALEQELCEECVSREQLEREIHAQMAVDAITKETAVDMLNHLPPVTLKPKTGPVLDKIRAEIEEYSLLTRERVIGIIDKYTAESEG